jgi:hypothetical protein
MASPYEKEMKTVTRICWPAETLMGEARAVAVKT